MTAPSAPTYLASAPAAAPPPGGAAPPGAPPGGPPFKRALEDQSARTALAEGHQQSPSCGRRRAAVNAQATSAALAATPTPAVLAAIPTAALAATPTAAQTLLATSAPSASAGSTSLPGEGRAPIKGATGAELSTTPNAPATVDFAFAGTPSIQATALATTTTATTTTHGAQPATDLPATIKVVGPSTTSLPGSATPAVQSSTGLLAPATTDAQPMPGAGADAHKFPPGAPGLPAGAPKLPPGAPGPPSATPSALPTSSTGEPPTAPSASAANTAPAAQSANSAPASPHAALPIQTLTSDFSTATAARGAQPDSPARTPASASPPASTPLSAPPTPASATPLASPAPRSPAGEHGPGGTGQGLTAGSTARAAATSTPTGAGALLADSPPPGQSLAPAGSQAPTLGYSVDLQRAIEAVHATVELATRQGLSRARIALQPEELGEIRIHLTQSASGLVARVTAATPAAAQALTEGRAELRQSLGSLGLTALHLDTGAFESSAHGREGHAPQHSAGSAAHGEGRAGDQDDCDLNPPPDPAPGAPRISRGALVDVLA